MTQTPALALTPAQRRALEAVRAGKAFRIYTRNCNRMHCDGVGSAVLWKLNYLKLIRDGRTDEPGAMQIRCPLELTDAGRKALWHQD